MTLPSRLSVRAFAGRISQMAGVALLALALLPFVYGILLVRAGASDGPAPHIVGWIGVALGCGLGLSGFSLVSGRLRSALGYLVVVEIAFGVILVLVAPTP